ncbi:MAG: FAD:protein FMN transferase, partial [Anaerolineae bacterium]|nr:FAD:protein FMN transferase [Anaerolineae bacterium]
DVYKRQAADRLCTHGAVLVDAGGDISVRQPCWVGDGVDAPPHPFVIGVANPHEPASDLEWLSLTEGGVATSGRDYRRWWRNDKPMHHLIDPRAGLPAQTDILSATVVAPSAQQADIAAKIWLILGSAAGTDWLESQPYLAGLAVLEDGAVVRSSRLERHVWSPSQWIETI